ncbi:hypothetical protein OH77DRAFT_417874 [Trametes cingulata]|nr:hypothetical protein OH77DRAFT_417874 [Trametes cingulata]
MRPRRVRVSPRLASPRLVLHSSHSDSRSSRLVPAGRALFAPFLIPPARNPPLTRRFSLRRALCHTRVLYVTSALYAHSTHGPLTYVTCCPPRAGALLHCLTQSWAQAGH